MLSTPVPHRLGPQGDLYADAVHEEGAPAEETYDRLHGPERRPPESPYGMASASERVNLMLAAAGLKRPLPDTPKLAPVLPRSPNSDYEEVDSFKASPGSRPSSPQEASEPALSAQAREAYAHRPLPPLPIAKPDLDPIYFEVTLDFDETEVRPRTPPPTPTRPSRLEAHHDFELEHPASKSSPPTPPTPPKPPRSPSPEAPPPFGAGGPQIGPDIAAAAAAAAVARQRTGL